MRLVKNHTPYKGKLRIKFERYPYYRSGDNKLNKVHLDLMFTKLVSRMYPYRTSNRQGFGAWEIDENKLQLINTYTGGRIGTHEWWYICDSQTGPCTKVYSQPENTLHTVDHQVLEDCFLHPDGHFIGGVEEGWWYFSNNMIVTDRHPHGVALVLKESLSKHPEGASIAASRKPAAEMIKGYYGYTHRGGCLFSLGDRIFNPEWRGLYTDTEIESIPFNERGGDIIRTWEEAEQAAINLSEYL